MPKTRTSRAKGTYYYAKRADGTKYRVYHSGSRGKGSYGYYNKKGPYRRSKSTTIPKRSRSTSNGRFGVRPYSVRTTSAKITSKHGDCCIEHEEFIGDIPGSKLFKVASLRVNPGLAGTFPWLSQMAENFEEYIPEKIEFIYRSTSSNAIVPNAGTSNSLGVVVMASEYNVSSPGFGNKQQMESYQGAMSKDPSLSFKHRLITSKGHNPLKIYYIRNGDVPPGQDARFYDIANFQIATSGMTFNGGTIGELWVRYKFRLLKPRLITSNELSNNPSTDHFQLDATTRATVTAASPFGTLTGKLITPVEGSNLGGRLSGGIVLATNQTPDFYVAALDANGNPTGDIANSIGDTYYFPAGVQSGLYLVFVNGTYTNGGTNPGYVIDSVTNCAAATLFNNSATGVLPQLATGSGNTTQMGMFAIQVLKNYASFLIVGTGSATTCTAADVFVIQIPLSIR